MFDIDLKQAGVTAAVFVRYITFYSSTTGFRLYFALFKVQRLKELPTYLNIPQCLGQDSFFRDAPPVGVVTSDFNWTNGVSDNPLM